MAETERVWVEQKKGEFVVRETLFQRDGEFARFYAIGRDGAFTLLREKLGDLVILVDKREYLEEAIVGSANSLEDVMQSFSDLLKNALLAELMREELSMIRFKKPERQGNL